MQRSQILFDAFLWRASIRQMAHRCLVLKTQIILIMHNKVIEIEQNTFLNILIKR